MSDITFRKLLEQRRLFYVLDNLALKYKKAVIDKADRKLIMDLCEGILNILNGNIKLSDHDRDMRDELVDLQEKIKKSKTLIESLKSRIDRPPRASKLVDVDELRRQHELEQMTYERDTRQLDKLWDEYKDFKKRMQN